MKAYCTTVLTQIENGIREWEEENRNAETRDKLITLIEQCIAELKEWMLHHNFSTPEEEVDVFKNLAPDIFAALIYHRKLKFLHNRLHVINRSIQKKYLRNELKKITCFFLANQELLNYYSNNSNDRDLSLFLRNTHEHNYFHDDYTFLMDHRFCPLATYKIAKMKAYQKLETDILAYLHNKQTLPAREETTQKTVQWTASKSAATELIYGLFASGVFNGGQAKLKEIVSVFEHTFHLSLEGYHRSYQDLKMRKKSRTSFLTDLRTQLENKMDEEE